MGSRSTDDSAVGLLEAAYKDLRYDEGALFAAADSPRGIDEPEEWINKGEWLSLAKRIGAEKIFFVGNNPVIVFARCASEEHRKRFQEIWNMGRPPLLFLASPGELAVYDLTQGPERTPDEWEAKLDEKRLKKVERIAQVSEKLHEYGRERIESGKLFEEVHFGDERRADKALVANLKVVRRALRAHKNLEAKYAHAIIGRSIFIRYLEDREVLGEEYFRKVAARNKDWQRILSEPIRGVFVDDSGGTPYMRVLRSKEFTYDVFKQLAKDFNGDMFPKDENERARIEQKHLDMLRGFLCGDNPEEPQIFFWAYKFDIIPIELISSIYEEFYNTERGKEENQGSYYTPPALVEFVLSQVLTKEVLEGSPRILDPACGSGIFLVEAFRRIVRHQAGGQGGRRLNRQQLLRILRDQIVGIDINKEAVRVAALSLYLAFLHYQKSRDILKHIAEGKRLPNLYYIKDSIADEQHFNNLFAANAFDLKASVDEEMAVQLGKDSIDVVVGNPPWGEYKSIGEEGQKVEAWCQSHSKSVGNKELSQAFLHLTTYVLKPEGSAALLVPTAGVFLNRANPSRKFRREWLNAIVLESVVNFDHVRDTFFNSSIAPFSSVVFKKKYAGQKSDGCFSFYSAKKTKTTLGLLAIILQKTDLHVLAQSKMTQDDSLWKLYWWGTHRDEALINNLKLNALLADLRDRNGDFIVDSGRGVTQGNEKNAITFLKKYKRILKTKCFRRYGQFRDSDFESLPKRVECERQEELFEGKRLLVKQSPSAILDSKGCIVARLEIDNLCFRHSIYSFRLREELGIEPKILLGILWSSLSRYYFFLTAASWGAWHDKISLDEFRKLPIRLPENADMGQRIATIVDKLTEYDPGPYDILENREGPTAEQIRTEIRRLERELDQEVFALYELDRAEQDLVIDMCEVGLDHFYNHVESEAVARIGNNGTMKRWGYSGELPGRREKQRGLDGYLSAFLHVWDRELEPDGRFRYHVVNPGGDIPMVCVVFETEHKSNPLPQPAESDMDQWKAVLRRLEASELVPFASKRVYLEGMVRAVGDTDIIIIKRNERRLWTRSMAREDAEATLLQAMQLQQRQRRK